MLAIQKSKRKKEDSSIILEEKRPEEKTVKTLQSQSNSNDYKTFFVCENSKVLLHDEKEFDNQIDQLSKTVFKERIEMTCTESKRNEESEYKNDIFKSECKSDQKSYDMDEGFIEDLIENILVSVVEEGSKTKESSKQLTPAIRIQTNFDPFTDANSIQVLMEDSQAGSEPDPTLTLQNSKTNIAPMKPKRPPRRKKNQRKTTLCKKHAKMVENENFTKEIFDMEHTGARHRSARHLRSENHGSSSITFPENKSNIFLDKTLLKCQTDEKQSDSPNQGSENKNSASKKPHNEQNSPLVNDTISQKKEETNTVENKPVSVRKIDPIKKDESASIPVEDSCKNFESGSNTGKDSTIKGNKLRKSLSFSNNWIRKTLSFGTQRPPTEYDSEYFPREARPRGSQQSLPEKPTTKVHRSKSFSFFKKPSSVENLDFKRFYTLGRKNKVPHNFGRNSFSSSQSVTDIQAEPEIDDIRVKFGQSTFYLLSDGGSISEEIFCKTPANASRGVTPPPAPGSEYEKELVSAEQPFVLPPLDLTEDIESEPAEEEKKKAAGSEEPVSGAADDVECDQSEAELSAHSDTDYFSFGSNESLQSCKDFYVNDPTDSDCEREDQAALGETEQWQQSSPPALGSTMLGNNRRKFSLSNESLEGGGSVSTDPGLGSGRPAQVELARPLSSSHPHLFTHTDLPVIAGSKNRRNKSAWKPLQKLKRIFKSSPKLTEADVYNNAYLQSTSEQVNITLEFTFYKEWPLLCR